MAIKRISIEGMRSFSKKTTIEFALPDGKTKGSGLNVLVGANNSGKTTVIEAMQFVSKFSTHVSKDMKNSHNNGQFELEIVTANKGIIEGATYKVSATKDDGAYVVRTKNGHKLDNAFDPNGLNLFILSSKRTFDTTFNSYGGHRDRETYAGNISGALLRENNSRNQFSSRLVSAIENKKHFNGELEKVLSPVPDWKIESLSGDSLFLEFEFDGVNHNSTGAGDGYVNIFNIIDALYDAQEGQVVVIDEPESSLNPDLQRKLFDLLVEKSKIIQIIITTHSPYFIDWKLLLGTSKLFRFSKTGMQSAVHALREETRNSVKGILNPENPHILGINANEIFFLNDKIILVEGQEDVICYKGIFEKYNYKPNASFFGWGIGGADKIDYALNVLSDLGYQQIFVILDGNKTDIVDSIKANFPFIGVFVIETDDVRDKKKSMKKNLKKMLEYVDINQSIKDEVLSKFDEVEFDSLISDFSKIKINPDHTQNIKLLIEEMTAYFSNSSKVNTKTSKTDEKPKMTMSEEQLLADKLASEFYNKHYKDYIENKYDCYKFTSREGGPISCKKIDDDNYYYVLEQYLGITTKFYARYAFHIQVNIKTKAVELIKVKCLEKNLP